MAAIVKRRAWANGRIGQASYTIASGVITITNPGLLIVDTEAAAVSDDLDTITYVGVQGGDIVVICAANNARDVVVKDAAGNMRTAGDFTLTHGQDTVTLIFNAVAGVWCELCRSDNTA